MLSISAVDWVGTDACRDIRLPSYWHRSNTSVLRCGDCNVRMGVGLSNRVSFRQGDATNLPFADEQFDAAMTIHVAMNIAAKDKMYAEARRILKPGGIFAVYDVLQGEGGEVLYPVPWAREPSISHLATPNQMKSLLTGAGFKLVDVQDSTDESQRFFEAMTAQMARTGSPPVAWRLFLGDDFPAMARNQVRNVTERRIRTVSYICAA
jgi:SAM-dependent methyltransferase